MGTLLRSHFACWTLLAAAAAGCGPSSPHFVRFKSRPIQAPQPETGAVGRPVIVLDIDETLSHTDYFDLILQTGREKSRPLRGAKDALVHLSRDFDIVYLTSRPTYLLGETTAWLTDHGFPAGPVYTAGNVAELVSVRTYKTRYLARLLERHPTACIGIGDRGSDADAYRANGMIAIIVNPDEDSDFSSRDIVLRSWTDVDAFFQANARLLKDFRNVRQMVRDGKAAFEIPSHLELVRYDDADDDHGRGKLNRALLKVFPRLRRHADDQAAGAEAVAERRSLAEAIDLAAKRWPHARLMSVSLKTAGNQPVVHLRLIQDQQLITVTLDPVDGRVMSQRSETIPAEASRIAAGFDEHITFTQAVEIASERIDGHPYDVRLRMEYRRPTYEVSLLSRKGFWEIDVDAASGGIQEIDHEWRLVPLN